MIRHLQHSMAVLIATELFASVVGFGVMVTLARRVGPAGFADFEYASSVAAWWLVVVRGGFDSIVYREASRRPQLIRSLSNLLIGLRLASSLVGLTAVFILAWVTGSHRGWVVGLAGLILIPSAMASDVGLRALGRFGFLALAQLFRALGMAFGVGWLVMGSGDAIVAVAVMVGAELLSTIFLLLVYYCEHGWIRLRFRRRAWACLTRRGAVAGATRFGRVSLYAADLLILGTFASASLGPYAAARRVVFAIMSLGLVVPSIVSPRIARACTLGTSETRKVINQTFEGLCIALLPATVGLILTSDRWMVQLFGEGFREGGLWLAVIAARLPFVMASNIQQTALVACRREFWSLILMAVMIGLGLFLIPPLVMFQGLWGLSLGVLAIEMVGAIGGWFLLRSLGIAPPWHHASVPALAGCTGLATVCEVGRDWPLGLTVLAGATVYGMILLAVGSRSGNSTLQTFAIISGESTP